MRRHRPRRWSSITASLALAGLLGACTPLYLPPVPPQLPEVEPRLNLRDARIEVRPDGRVRAAWIPEGVTRAGWLDVQWFPPAGGAVASESVWLAAEDEGQRQAVFLPEEVELRPGRWRAVLSFDDRILRQLAWQWPPEDAE